MPVHQDHILAQLTADTKSAGLTFKFVVTAAILQHAAPVARTPATQVRTPEYVIPGFSSQGRPWGIHDPVRLSRKNRLLLRGPGATWEQVLADEEAIAAKKEEEAIAAKKDAKPSSANAPPGHPAVTSPPLEAPAPAPAPARPPTEEAVGRTGRFFGLKASWDRHDGDGMWDCTWEGGLDRGFDVVVCVLYFEV